MSENQKFTLIAGASSGIGAATAFKLAVSNNLILWGRDIERLNKVKNKCIDIAKNTKNFESPEPIIISCDLGENLNIENEFKTIKDSMDYNIVIDKFVHCAGIVEINAVKNFSYEAIKNMFNINVFSAMEIIKHLVRKKYNNKALENVVFISSVSSDNGYNGSCYYAATKGAIDSYMKSMAKELAPKVRCNSIQPATVNVMNSTMANCLEESKEIDENYLLGAGNVDDVVNMIEFLLSNKSRWITGQKFVVDGGFTL